MSKLRFAPLILLLFVLAINIVPLSAQDPIIIRQLDHLVVQTPAFDLAIEQFEADHPGVQIEREVLTNAAEVLQFAFTDPSTAPHVFIANILEPAQMRSLVDAGYVYSLDQFPDWEEFLSRFPAPDAAVAPGQNVYDDVVVSMKFDADQWWHQYYINLNLYEQAGIVDDNGDPIIPSTWEAMVENAYTIHEATGAYGFSYPGANPGLFGFYWWTCYLSSIAYGPRGFGYDMRTGEFTAAENPCFETIITDLLRMRDDGILPPDMLAIDDEPNRALFAEDQVAHILTGVWAITGWEQTHPEFTNYTSVPVPLVGVDAPTKLYPQNPAGVFLSISTAAAEDPALLEATWEWYKFIYSEEFGRIWAETGNGLSIFTPGDPQQYATQQNAGAFASAQFFAPDPEPQLARRNPDVGRLEQTLIGPTEADVLVGIFSGQITDWREALADLDARYTEAFEIALEDAQAAGANLTIEDFIVRDWVPEEPYTTPLEPGHYPGASQ
ncbi:MAG: extracellular solute-binding protein [bacterium]|nr:extracellular solute-binding protein [bacterium]